MFCFFDNFVFGRYGRWGAQFYSHLLLYDNAYFTLMCLLVCSRFTLVIFVYSSVGFIIVLFSRQVYYFLITIRTFLRTSTVSLIARLFRYRLLRFYNV